MVRRSAPPPGAPTSLPRPSLEPPRATPRPVYSPHLQRCRRPAALTASPPPQAPSITERQPCGPLPIWRGGPPQPGQPGTSDNRPPVSSSSRMMAASRRSTNGALGEPAGRAAAPRWAPAPASPARSAAASAPSASGRSPLRPAASASAAAVRGRRGWPSTPTACRSRGHVDLDVPPGQLPRAGQRAVLLGELHQALSRAAVDGLGVQRRLVPLRWRTKSRISDSHVSRTGRSCPATARCARPSCQGFR